MTSLFHHFFLTDPENASDLIDVYVDCNGERQVPTLQTLCADTLSNDVCLLEIMHERIPANLQFLILCRAFEKDHILSAATLIRVLKSSTFPLPIPTAPVRCRRSLRCVPSLQNVFTHYERRTSLFFDRPYAVSIHLQLLDFSTLHLSRIFLEYLLHPELPPTPRHFLKRCSVKTSFRLQRSSDVSDLVKVLDRFHEKLIVSALAISLDGPFKVYEKETVKVFNRIRPEDLRRFSYGYCGNSFPSEIFSGLRKFKNLSSLELTYIIDLSKGNKMELLSQTLRELHRLQSLSLLGTVIHDLSTLLRRGCVIVANGENMDKRKKTKISCSCLVHRGRLRTLFLSGCLLKDENLPSLREVFLHNHLQALDISGNLFQQIELAKCLEELPTTIQYLNLDDCVRDVWESQLIFIALRRLVNLRYLNVHKILSEEDHFDVFIKSLDFLKNIKCIVCPIYDTPTFVRPEIFVDPFFVTLMTKFLQLKKYAEERGILLLPPIER